MPKAVAAVVVLHGEERFLVEEKARGLISDWQRELVSDFGFEPIDAAGLNAARLQDSVLQAPFLDPYRVIWVRGVAPQRAEGLAPALVSVPSATTPTWTTSRPTCASRSSSCSWSRSTRCCARL